MITPLLQLTADEQRWNAHYDTPGRRGVKLLRYPYELTLTAAARAFTVRHTSTRRARVWGLSFAGDFAGATIHVRKTSAETVTQGPTHIPLLCGGPSHDPYSRLPNLAGYPTAANVVGFATAHAPAGPGWYLNPNVVLAADTELAFDFGLADPADVALFQGGATYRISLIVHTWEFPGFGGVA